MKKIVLPAFILFSILFIASCTKTQLRPVENNLQDFTIPANRDASFTAMLSVAQAMGLQVDVIEKASGLIQFKNTALSPIQLDKYCHYPVIKSEGGAPFSTYTEWNTRSLEGKGGAVAGTATITLLTSDDGTNTRVSMRSKWVVGNLAISYECQSKNVLEEDFKKTVLDVVRRARNK